MGDQVVEGAGQVAGAGDVRAGEPDLEESFVVLRTEVFPAAHDPRGDLPGAGDVGADGFGGAVAEGGEVFADGLDAAAVALGSDLGEDLGCGDAAAGVGEAGGGVCLERREDAGGASVAGGGEEDVEVGVAEAAHGLAVQVEAAGDGADGPAGIH
nr:hypothetical protein [Streptomyces sp. V4I2]